MSIQVKIADGSVRRVVTPWVCTAPGTVLACHHVWVEVAEGDVREAYPLQPDPVTGSAVSTVYRNDRIEVDVDWEPGAGGEPPAYYNVNFHIPNVTISDHRVNAPTDALTFTNNGNGYHTWAGQTVIIRITPYSIADRPGDTVQVSTTIAQLPAPPMPATLSVNVSECRSYVTWTSTGGRRQDGIQVRQYAPQIGVDWYGNYGQVNLSGGDITPWNAGAIGGTDLHTWIRAYGPGGYSGWRQVSGSIPGPVTVNTYRIYENNMIADCSNAFVGQQVWTQTTDGGWTYHTFWGNGRIHIGGDWPRDNSTQRRLMLRPYNTSNGWTGRDQYYGWVRKMANPYYFQSDGVLTRRQNAWRTEPGLAYHGATSPGNNAAYAFYNTKFNDSLGDHVTGYHLQARRLQLNLYRTGNHGVAAPVAIKTWVHRSQNAFVGDLSYGGGVDIGPINRDEGGWYDMPAGWANHLMHVEDGYRGILLYHTNDALTVAGGVSYEYAILLDQGWQNAGYWCFGVAITHDG